MITALRNYLHFNTVPFMASKGKMVGVAFSLLITLASLTLVTMRGLNFGIDFAGGILIEIQVTQTPDLGALRTKVENLGLGSVSLQEFGSPNDIMIRVQQQAGGEAAQQQAIDKIRTALGTDVTYRRVESVGPQVGADLIKKGLWAVIGATAGILLYIMFRFQTPYAVGAVMALLHDVALTLGYFALTQTEFSLSTVAAVLTVAGYSINDTVVVFDRVREMLRKYQKRDIAEVLDIALTTTLSRTFFTGLSTLIALIALMIFGGPVIRSFVDAMIIGILAGTYSSIYVACPVLVKMQGMLGRPKVNEA